MEYLIKLLKKIGVDKSIAYSSGGRVVQGITGIGSVFFIGAFLSPEEQGFYFTFGSLLALQVFFELGLHNVLTQFTAHEQAHLQFDKNYNLIGPDENKSRLSSILRFSVRLFIFISIAFFIIIAVLGLFFFNSSSQGSTNNIDWILPWIFLSLMSSVALFLSPIYAILMGLNRVKEISKIRFLQSCLMPLSVWIGLFLGLKLYVSSISILVSIVIGIVVVMKKSMFLQLKNIWKAKGEHEISYTREIFPLQWKIALSWISGYFIYQLFNPILFHYVGADAAGKMGMTMQVINAIQAFSFSWMSTKIPVYSSYIAKKEFLKLDCLFGKTLIQMLSVCMVTLIAFIAVLQVVDFVLPLRISERFLSGFPLWIICLSIIPNQLVSSYANYLRCYKKEPLVMMSVVIALLCICSSFLCTYWLGVVGMVCGYTFIITFIELPWTYGIYKAKRKEWQLL